MSPKWLEFGLVEIKVGNSGACIIRSFNDTHIVCQVAESVTKQGAIIVSVGNLCVSIGDFHRNTLIACSISVLVVGIGW